jgi:hypothetical protein
MINIYAVNFILFCPLLHNKNIIKIIIIPKPNVNFMLKLLLCLC